MKRYHINTRGEIGLCAATISCPFGDLERDHYPDSTTARSAFEYRMGASFDYRGRSLKSLDYLQLKKAILQEAPDGVDLAKLESSIELATLLHEGQVRSDPVQGREKTAYIEHPLRNTLRLIRMGVSSDVTIQASVFHDTVEDCSRRFVLLQKSDVDSQDEAACRRELANHIGSQYSPATMNVVLGVTNPLGPAKEQTRAEKNAAYKAHVEEEILQSTEVFLVKYSDFLDNAGSIHWSNYPGNERRVRNLAGKYRPVVESFRAAMAHHDFTGAVQPWAIENMAYRLDKVSRRLDEVLNHG